MSLQYTDDILNITDKNLTVSIHSVSKKCTINSLTSPVTLHQKKHNFPGCVSFETECIRITNKSEAYSYNELATIGFWPVCVSGAMPLKDTRGGCGCNSCLL